MLYVLRTHISRTFSASVFIILCCLVSDGSRCRYEFSIDARMCVCMFYHLRSLVRAEELIFALLSRFCLTNSIYIFFLVFFFSFLFLCVLPEQLGCTHRHTHADVLCHLSHANGACYVIIIVIISVDCAIHYFYKYPNRFDEMRMSAQQLNTRETMARSRRRCAPRLTISEERERCNGVGACEASLFRCVHLTHDSHFRPKICVHSANGIH